MRRWLLRIGIGMVALVVGAAVLAFDFVRSFQRSLPVYDGVVAAAGLAAAVRVDRDRYAIPHIRANSFDEAAFGLGYAHAQDRLWQMELSRRYVQGRLAELFGDVALQPDIMTRTIGLYAAAEEAVKHLKPETVRTLDRYAAGVNAFLATHRGPLPIEFSLAGDTPEPWRPADSIAVLKGMAMMLSENAFGEAGRVRLMGLLGRKGAQDFLPPFGEVPLPAYLDELYGATRVGDAYGIPDTTASDNWVVDGKHSETGKPLLANDPHLGFSIPSTWYLAHLAFPGDDLVGGTLPGVPAIIVGHNRHVAWGLTNTGSDTQDLFIERLNPDNSNEYRVPGGWAEFDTRAETIKVRFGAERRILVRTTRHGPVVDSVPGGFAGSAPKGAVTALQWTALADDDTTMDAVREINRATDANSFRAAMRFLVAPMQNVVYADDGGHIGVVLPGRVPIRAAQNDARGLVPAPGWDGRYDWQGIVPPERAAQIVDPPSGRIVTANNKTVPDGYPYRLAYAWEPPYRHDRIDALLTGRLLRSPSGPTAVFIDAHSQATGLAAATSIQSVASFRAIQLDVVDTYALALKSRLVAAGPFAGADAAAADLMAGWNGAMARDRPEPLVFAAWARALARRLYSDELGQAFERYWGYRPELTLRVLDNIDGQARWCDDRTTTTEEENCASRIRAALHDAVAELSAAYGPDPARWRWGEAHKAAFSNRPLGDLPFVGPFFAREIEMDGGPFTPLRADNSMSGARPYAAIHGAGYRGIYDVADEDRSLYIISTGQSGNAYSPHYDDLMPLWAKGQYVAIHTQPAAIDAEAFHRLTLQPVSGASPP